MAKHGNKKDVTGAFNVSENCVLAWMHRLGKEHPWAETTNLDWPGTWNMQWMLFEKDATNQ